MGKYLNISEIKAFQIDITSKCNLICPQCSRTDKGKLNPMLPMMELSPEDYDIIFMQNCPQLEEIVLNGNYGDPIASKHIDYLIEKAESKNIRLKIYNQKKKTQYEIKSAENSNLFEQILNNKYKSSYNNFLNETSIDGKYKNWKILFIDFSMRVYPCCWIGEFPYSLSPSKKKQFDQLLKKYGTHFNNLKHNSLEEILNRKWFNHDLVTSWRNKTNDVVNPRWAKCSQICSSDYGFTNVPGSQNNTLYQL